jgi:Rrf2 family protein
MFSKPCEYGIRAMLYIARKSREGVRVGIREIAAEIDSPEPFMAKILQRLSRKHLVSSVKGPNGGFYLQGKQLRASLADIVLAIDGDGLFQGCGLGLQACSDRKPCPIHYEFKEIRSGMRSMLESTALEDFAERLEEGRFYLKRA